MNLSSDTCSDSHARIHVSIYAVCCICMYAAQAQPDYTLKVYALMHVQQVQAIVCRHTMQGEFGVYLFRYGTNHKIRFLRDTPF